MRLHLTAPLYRLLPGLAAVALTALLAAFASAWGDTEAGPLDSKMTLRVRQAFHKDPQLGPLNLGVSVRLSTAILWGDVSDAGQAARAVTVARQVPGILAVQNELHVVPADDPYRELVKRAPPRPAAEPRVSLLQRPAGTLTSQPEPPLGVTLLPPLIVPVVAKPDDLSASIHQLTGAEPRFRGLNPRIDGGIVRLAGSAGRWEDVMELAQRISRVSGVARVILEDVQAPR